MSTELHVSFLTCAYASGDRLYALYPAFKKYHILKALGGPAAFRVLKNEEGLPWSVYVGMAGMPGESLSHIQILGEH